MVVGYSKSERSPGTIILSSSSRRWLVDRIATALAITEGVRNVAWWILTAVVAVVALFLAALYRRSLKESQCLTGLLIQVLLDQETYNFQKQGLQKLVSEIPAKNALELSTKVQLSVSRLAVQLGGSVLLASHTLLWNTRQTRLSGTNQPGGGSMGPSLGRQ